MYYMEVRWKENAIKTFLKTVSSHKRHSYKPSPQIQCLECKRVVKLSQNKVMQKHEGFMDYLWITFVLVLYGFWSINLILGYHQLGYYPLALCGLSEIF